MRERIDLGTLNPSHDERIGEIAGRVEDRTREGAKRTLNIGKRHICTCMALSWNSHRIGRKAREYWVVPLEMKECFL